VFAYLLAALPAEFQSTPSGGKATGQPPRASATEVVSIHAFRGEGDVIGWINSLIDVWFQSTPSGGKATQDHRRDGREQQRFNPRLPGGRRQPALPTGVGTGLFQSTPSGGKATVRDAPGDCRIAVSIHAFRGEGDTKDVWMNRYAISFNPRLPGGRRRSVPQPTRDRAAFQSTPSGGKATGVSALISEAGTVSIHAFRGEGDCT